jgi:hypothetical protein
MSGTFSKNKDLVNNGCNYNPGFGKTEVVYSYEAWSNMWTNKFKQSEMVET